MERCHILVSKVEGVLHMIYGYSRVSTKGQIENNSLEQQRQEMKNKYPDIKIVAESFTGTTADRPELNKLIGELKANDTLVVTKLDRLARNVVEGIEVVQRLFDLGVSVHVLQIGLLENTTMGKFFLTTLLAVAEMERNTIVERTQAGKEIAKQRPGFIEGRPKEYSNKQIQYALSLLSVNGGTMSYNQVSETIGISKATLIRAQRANNSK